MSDFACDQVAKALCERALSDAKSQLHPLLQNTELDRLDLRPEFLRAFKHALEYGISRQVASWHPGIQAIFSYDETPFKNIENWQGSIHLLIKVRCLTEDVKELGKSLDSSLVNYLKQLSWHRFRPSKTILAIQQVTLDELRCGVGYGAMFYAMYNVPIKVWSPDNQNVGSSNTDSK